MKVSVKSQINIKDSPKAVFKYLADSSYHFLWNPHLQTISPQGPLKLGQQYKTTSLMLGTAVKGTNKIAKYDSGRELQIENSTGLLKYTVNYYLELQAQMTRLVCTTEVTADSKAFAFSAPILKLLARRELQSDLRALKIAVEQKLA